MKVVVTGGSGFIGSKLVDALRSKGHEPVVLDRRPPRDETPYHEVDLMQAIDSELFAGVDAVIHLAGASIFQRWTEEAKKLIYDTRIVTTNNIVDAFRKLDQPSLKLRPTRQPPKIFISASAVGFYGARGDETLTEESKSGDDFLAKVCRDWEAAAAKAKEFGVRVVHIRTAPVLGKGGLLGTLLPLYKWGLGGPLGTGRQWFPWVHLEDIVGGYLFALEHENITGPLNVVAPQQVRNYEFAKTLGSVVHRPSYIPTPRWAMKLMFNSFADAILASQRVSSRKLKKAGYSFRFADLKSALKNVLQ